MSVFFILERRDSGSCGWCLKLSWSVITDLLPINKKFTPWSITLPFPQLNLSWVSLFDGTGRFCLNPVLPVLEQNRAMQFFNSNICIKNVCMYMHLHVCMIITPYGSLYLCPCICVNVFQNTINSPGSQGHCIWSHILGLFSKPHRGVWCNPL